MNISIIIPLYYGANYVMDLINMIRRNVLLLESNIKVEIIFINDSPEQNVEILSNSSNKDITIELLVNDCNQGIHYSRVRGVEHATGKYILFLDQDDYIEDNYLMSQCKSIGDYDVIVSNGIAECKNFKKQLYRYGWIHITVKYIMFYVVFSCRIISPGQCLVKKEAIPQVWKEKILKNNGSDDYFLWLLLLTELATFTVNRDVLFVHKYTGINTSSNLELMKLSDIEMLENLNGILKKRIYHILEKRIRKKQNNIVIEIATTIIEKMNHM
ncbi:MAG: glycosyltransferase family 2 protein [Eubacteriales bacterium]